MPLWFAPVSWEGVLACGPQLVAYCAPSSWNNNGKTMKLDAAAFERLARKRKFQPRTLEIARRLLVRGEKARELAHAYGLNIQRIYNIGMQVSAAYQAERLPPGWIEVTICGPEKMIRDFERKVAEARKRVKAHATKAGGAK